MSSAKFIPVPAGRSSRRAVIVASTLLLTILFASGCTGTSAMSTGGADMISVEGRVTYYGNTPFEQAVLVTDDGNWYVLDLSDEQHADLTAPSRQRVIGRVFRGDWNGRPFARLDVRTMQRVD